jgi:hypothetical protein
MVRRLPRAKEWLERSGKLPLAGLVLVAFCFRAEAETTEFGQGNPPLPAVPYPGFAPGPTRLSAAGNTILFSNQVISASWPIASTFAGPGTFTDAQSGDKLQLEGFEIRLKDGAVCLPSDFTLDGTVSTGEWKPPGGVEARLAARLATQQLVVPLRTADGRMRMTWRVLAPNGANYLRQELELTAASSDCAIQSITWVRSSLPGARVLGQVDGSVVSVGSFFVACEDPHALNQAGPGGVEIGSWSPEDINVGARRSKKWTVPNSILCAGTNRLVFRYTAGPHRLDVWRVALWADGHEAARDEHHGRAGSEHVDNSYLLFLPEFKPAARYELVAEIGTDPDFQFPPGETANSSGIVEVLTETNHTMICQLPRNSVLKRGDSLKISFVVGVSPPGQLRRAFLHYLEQERAHPYRPYLHYNSWYDIAWAPFALNETNCLEAIRIVGNNLIQRHGVIVDGMVFDDGWDDPGSLWAFHAGFPKGFAPLTELCTKYHTRLGVWLSPFGGYGEPKAKRLQFGGSQGYETNAAGFSLAGPKYYSAFKQACLGMIRNFGVNHFKFDGIATGMYASGGGQYMLDTEAMRRLMLDLREADPELYINLTTGSWPSPFWLRYADSVWRQGGDMGHAGKGSKQQQWLTYRDQETYRNIVRKGPLYPLNSLMTQGVAYSRHGLAGDPSFDSAGFRDDVRAFFGSGTGLQELYIQPDKLSAEDWRVLAEAAKWSRANADVLVDTHWFGGDPGRGEVYGFASWTPRKGILMLRNPDPQPQVAAFDPRTVFELPEAAAKDYLLRCPWSERAEQPELRATAGQTVRIPLKPFEVVVLEAIPSAPSGNKHPISKPDRGP